MATFARGDWKEEEESLSCSAPASHVQEDDDEEETHGAEAVMAAKAGWSSDMRLNESEEEEKGSLVDEDEEDDEVGVSLRMLLGGLWYGMVLLMAAAGLVVMLPHIYMAMPRCEAWCQGYHVVASVESGKRCEDLCGDVSGTVAALVEQTRELVHEIMSIVLPLPSQPGTEQYWDVRLRRSLRRLLAPASVHKSDMSALLLLPCRELPLQHLCNLTSEWGHVRLGWHLDMMHQVLDDQRKRSTLQEQHSDPTSAHRSTKLASINDPQPAQQCRGQDTHGAWRGREGRGAGGKGSGGGGGVGQRRRSGAHASTYDRLCQKQFGQGAAFDGEMCACKAGFQVKGGVCVASKQALKEGAVAADVGRSGTEGGAEDKGVGDGRPRVKAGAMAGTKEKWKEEEVKEGKERRRLGRTSDVGDADDVRNAAKHSHPRTHKRGKTKPKKSKRTQAAEE